MSWQLLFFTALDAIGFKKHDAPKPRAYEGIRERKGEEAKRYLEQANRSLTKLQKKRDEKLHECA
jgi:hypothetical protein